MAKKRQLCISDKASGTANESKVAKKENSNDWISALAKQATTEAASSASSSILSKQERIERRNAKRRRRQERRPTGTAPARSINGVEMTSHRDGYGHSRGMNPLSQYCLERLASQILACSSALEEKHGRKKPYQCPESLKRGKATSGGKWSEETIQPRKRDYGGLGIARPSLYLSLRDQSFVPRLEEEFSQHIPGFFGKQRTKAMKRQLDGNMLWRRLAEKKTDNQKIQGKQLSDMTPDERVEAMINAGML